MEINNKATFQALSAFLSLHTEQVRSPLNEVDQAAFNRLRIDLVSKPPRLIVETLLAWNAQGRPSFRLHTAKATPPEQSDNVQAGGHHRLSHIPR